ncbi:hypothetical protein WMY93_007261 [Mugilogobius chulae]|uniref:Golgin subfamily A member 7/ERF4 domain-containing protein n=1 Tax=Mugilogobius chulae TaxID=88201 RepID=A0AAW0PYF5_9GOBI
MGTSQHSRAAKFQAGSQCLLAIRDARISLSLVRACIQCSLAPHAPLGLQSAVPHRPRYRGVLAPVDSGGLPGTTAGRTLVTGNMATEFHNLQELRHSVSLATKVFIQRDYSEGTVCRFQSKFPSELDNRIERSLLEETVKTLNTYYTEAEKIGGQSYMEGCLGCATAYFVFLCMETRYEKVLKKISGYIQEQNEKIYAPRGLLLTDPIERGMRVLEISVYEDQGCSSSSPSSSSMSSACSSAR